MHTLERQLEESSPRPTGTSKSEPEPEPEPEPVDGRPFREPGSEDEIDGGDRWNDYSASDDDASSASPASQPYVSETQAQEQACTIKVLQMRGCKLRQRKVWCDIHERRRNVADCDLVHSELHQQGVWECKARSACYRPDTYESQKNPNFKLPRRKRK